MKRRLIHPVRDAALSVLDSGGTGATLLLIHGAYLSGRSWKAQVKALSGQFRVIVPDLRGHGQSGVGGLPYSVAQFADDMRAVLDGLKVDRAHVCGHSLGGMVAQQLALDAPQQVETLILAETSYGTGSTPLEAWATRLTNMVLRRVSIRRQASLFAASMCRHDRSLAPYVLDEISAFHDQEEVYTSIWRAVTGFSSVNRLGELKMPTLVMVGERNRQTHAQARNLARRLPDAEVKIVPQAGHLLQLEQPEAFNKIVTHFLNVHQRPVHA